MRSLFRQSFRDRYLSALLASILASGTALAVHCSNEGRLEQASPFFVPGATNSAILRNISVNVILATYVQLEADVNALSDSVIALQTTRNTTNLATARTRWLAARTTMKQAEMYFYGPSANLFVDSNIDGWMRNNKRCNRTTDCGTSVDGIIAGSLSISVSDLGTFGAVVRGFPAVEYLLYDNGAGSSTEADVVAALTGRRLTYLVSATGDMVNTAVRLRSGWDSGGLNYAEQLASAGPGNSEFPTTIDGLSKVISGMLTVMESIKDKKIGFPAGLTVASGGTVRLPDVESPFANNSLSEISAALLSVENVYLGRFGSVDGIGLTDSVGRINADLDANIKNQFAALQTQVSALQSAHGNLPTAITNDIGGVRALFDAVGALRTTLTTDLVATSGTSPGISPNDGD